MSEYSIALSPRNASAAITTMGMSGNTYSRIVITSLECFEAVYCPAGSFQFVRNRNGVGVAAGASFASIM
jgi:hypothetical protein